MLARVNRLGIARRSRREKFRKLHLDEIDEARLNCVWLEPALTGERLFQDRIEAWKYGPVIPSLCRVTRHFGRKPIEQEMISDAPLSNPDRRFLASVVDNYGDYSGGALSNLTHRPGTPWHRVYEPDELGLAVGAPALEHPDGCLLGKP